MTIFWEDENDSALQIIRALIVSFCSKTSCLCLGSNDEEYKITVADVQLKEGFHVCTINSIKWSDARQRHVIITYQFTEMQK